MTNIEIIQSLIIIALIVFYHWLDGKMKRAIKIIEQKDETIELLREIIADYQKRLK